MLKYFLIFIFNLSIILTQTYFDNNFDEFNESDNVQLHLDFNNTHKSSYLLSKYYPNHFSDYNLYSLSLSGTMNDPLFHMITEKPFFDLEHKGKISQLSYREQKRDDFFDTKIALKVDLAENLRFIGFAESKSLSKNINQNFLLNINKTNKKSKVGISYFYHINDSPIEYMNENLTSDCEVQNYYSSDLNCGYQSFQRFNESYILGFDYTYNYKKIKISHNSSFKLSNTKKDYDSFEATIDDLNYNSKYTWHKDSFNYLINDNFAFYLNQSYKKTNIENYANSILPISFENVYKIGGLYKKGNYEFDVNYNLLGYSDISFNEYDFFPGYAFKYVKSFYEISFGLDYKLMSNTYLDNESNLNLLYSYYSKDFLRIKLNRSMISADIDLGEINVDYFNGLHPLGVSSFDYNYIILSAKIFAKAFEIDFKHNFYNSDYTYINQNTILGLKYSPVIEQVRYRPYVNFLLNSMVINSIYDLNLNTKNLFNFNLENLINEDKRVTTNRLEIGLIFDSFNIAYVITNPFNERYSSDVQYSDFILPELGQNSKLHIKWIFKE